MTSSDQPEQHDQSPAPSGRAKPAAAERDAWLSERAGQTLPSRNVDPQAEENARLLAIDIARSLHDDKCEDILVLDLRGHSQVTDFFVIASGTSERQMRSAAHHTLERAEQQGFSALRHNLDDGPADWYLVDLVDVVVHVFDPQTRLYYDLEMLWGDAERVPWPRPGDDVAGGGLSTRNRAGLTARERLEREDVDTDEH